MDLLINRDRPGEGAYSYGVLMMPLVGLNLQTMELPWLADPAGGVGGEPDQSCVPVGRYELVLHSTAAHPKTFALVNPDLGVYHDEADVPEGTLARTDVLIHNGNVATQSKACILVGVSRFTLNGVPAVSDSVQALLKFLRAVPWVAGHTLTITGDPTS